MKITIYTIPDCQFCKQEKDYLTSKGLPFDEKDVMANKDFLAEMLQKSQNFAGVPFTTIEEGTSSVILKGFTQSEFDDALAKMTGMPAASKEVLGDVASEPMADAPLTNPDMNMPASNSVASDMPKPAMPRMDVSEAPSGVSSMSANSNMTSMSSMTSMPNEAAAPVMASQSASVLSSEASDEKPLDDPQDELNSLLEDLQTKVDTSPSAPSAPSMPAPSVQSPSAPVIPATPNVQSPAAPVIPATPSIPNIQAMPTAPTSTPSMSAMPNQPMSTQAPAVPDFKPAQ